MRYRIFGLLIVLLLTVVTTNTDAQFRKNRNFNKNNCIGQMNECRLNLEDKLNLTADQKEKIEKLRSTHQKEMVDLKASMEKLHLEMKDLRQSGDLKRSDVLAKVEQINNLRSKITLKAANHRMDVYEILTPEQRKVWEDIKPFRNGKGNGRGNGRGNCGF